MIHECTCRNQFQDSVYGLGKRVFNPMKAANQFRCTGCGKTITVGSAVVKEKKSAEKAKEVAVPLEKKGKGKK